MRGSEPRFGVWFWQAFEVESEAEAANFALAVAPDQSFVGTVTVKPEYQRLGLSSRIHDLAFQWTTAKNQLFYSGFITSPENQAYWEKLEREGRAQPTYHRGEPMFLRTR